MFRADRPIEIRIGIVPGGVVRGVMMVRCVSAKSFRLPRSISSSEAGALREDIPTPSSDTLSESTARISRLRRDSGLGGLSRALEPVSFSRSGLGQVVAQHVADGGRSASELCWEPEARPLRTAGSVAPRSWRRDGSSGRIRPNVRKPELTHFAPNRKYRGISAAGAHSPRIPMVGRGFPGGQARRERLMRQGEVLVVSRITGRPTSRGRVQHADLAIKPNSFSPSAPRESSGSSTWGELSVWRPASSPTGLAEPQAKSTSPNIRVKCSSLKPPTRSNAAAAHSHAGPTDGGGLSASISRPN